RRWYLLKAESRIDDADLHPAIGSPRIRAVAANPGVGLSISPGAQNAGIEACLHQIISHRLGPPFRKLLVVFLRADVVRVAVHVYAITLQVHQNAGDAAEHFAILGPQIGLVKIELDRVTA